MPATKPGGRSLVLPIALALVVALGVVAVIASRGGSGGSDDGADDDQGGESAFEQVRSVDVVGSPLATYQGNPTTDAARGATMPTITGRTFDGASIQIGGQLGHAQLVFAVAHWCPHCQKEVPIVVDWLEEQGTPEGVELVALSTGVNEQLPNYPPSEWLDREGWPMRTMADDEEGTAAQALGLSGYPFFVAIDANGKVVARGSGELTVTQIEQLVDLARGA